MYINSRMFNTNNNTLRLSNYDYFLAMLYKAVILPHFFAG